MAGAGPHISRDFIDLFASWKAAWQIAEIGTDFVAKGSAAAESFASKAVVEAFAAGTVIAVEADVAGTVTALDFVIVAPETFASKAVVEAVAAGIVIPVDSVIVAVVVGEHSAAFLAFVRGKKQQQTYFSYRNSG
ncbi:hypothetical protein RIF29_28303 [Crotalaria pallida]|uniref:Uncharacterized protein n=1 Tax=Crotalaria pallida TaxID=3830 RepID=A0AAN9ET18_CROPI